MAANNVTGAVQPVSDVADLCAERGVPLHVDAVQAAAGCDVRALPGDSTIAIAAHKLGGPKGVGVLAGPGVASLPAVVRGGGQERGLRPGTENVAGAAALAAALAERQGRGAVAERDARAALRDRLEREAGLPVASAGAPRLPGHALLLAGVRGDLVVHQLDGEGICVAAGSACAAGSAEPSYVLAAMGIDPATARGAVRVTLGPESVAAEVDAFLAALGSARAGLLRAVESVA
jgi:cysteine desulfurase